MPVANYTSSAGGPAPLPTDKVETLVATAPLRLVGEGPNKRIELGPVSSESIRDRDAAPDVASLRTLGSGPRQAMPGNAKPGGTPSGHAGGDLDGEYPSPTVRQRAILRHHLSPELLALIEGAMRVSARPGGPPTGRAGGDLDGEYPAPSIREAMVLGRHVRPGALTDRHLADDNVDGDPDVPSLRTLGHGAGQAMPGSARPGGPPTGGAGGDLDGDFPSPRIRRGALTDEAFHPRWRDGASNLPCLRSLGRRQGEAMPGDAVLEYEPDERALGAWAGAPPRTLSQAVDRLAALLAQLSGGPVP